MRRIALLCLCLTSAGCTVDKLWHDSSVAGPRPPPAGDGPVMRRLMGQDPGVEPLLPEPGDIWADVMPKAQPASPPPVLSEHRGIAPPRVAAGMSAPRRTPHGTADVPASQPSSHAATVQLVAADSAKRAEAEWRQLRQRLPKLVQGHQPVVSAADVDGRKVWRLRAEGFATVAEAGAFCASVRAVKSKCWVVGP